jgi:hypothetical protein
MPYITPQTRLEVAAYGPTDAGELNYALTMLVMAYLRKTGKTYQHINDVLGALEGCKLELYRRVVVPYEQDKMATNTDVYEKL